MVEYWKDTTTPQFEGEIWKDIPGFEGYQISNFGRIKSLDRVIIRKDNCTQSKKGKVLKSWQDNLGYLKIDLRQKRTCLVHRLVMLTFVGECPKGKEVDHINTNRQDNRLQNLRYVTHKENGNNKNTIKHLKEANKPCKAIIQLDLQGNFIKKWVSISEAARQVTNGNGYHISQCAKGVRNKAYGFKWKYANK